VKKTKGNEYIIRKSRGWSNNFWENTRTIELFRKVEDDWFITSKV